MVDAEDLWLSKYSWSICYGGWRGSHRYAQGRVDGKMVLMHRLIAGTSKGEQTHHIDKRTLNNRRRNLTNVNRATHRELHAA